MDSVPVCKLCLEPITNFICPDCLYRAVQQWVWKAAPGIVEKFGGFHRKFIETVVSHKTAFCIACKKEYYHMVCSYDYMKEVYAWMGDRITEKKLKEFLGIFSLGFRKIDKKAAGRFFYRNGGPVWEKNETVDIGFCEACVNFSCDLKIDDSNQTVCENCR